MTSKPIPEITDRWKWRKMESGKRILIMIIWREREALAVRSCRTEKSSLIVRVAPKSRSNDAAAAYQIAARRWNRSRCVSVEPQWWHNTRKWLWDVSVEVQMRLQFLLSENAWENTRTLAPCLWCGKTLVTLELKLFAIGLHSCIDLDCGNLLQSDIFLQT
jgi:hypothetical protein